MIESKTNFAQIEILPAEISGKILSARSVDMIRKLNAIAPLLWVIGIAIAIFGSMDAFWIVSICVGFSLIIFASLISMRDLKNFWLRHVARQEIKNRRDKLVDPDNLDSRFVEVVPKSNWGIKIPENATDIGFLSIDFQNKQILFEGDNERYCIPAEAIINCHQDSYSRSMKVDKYGARYQICFYFVIITTRISERAIAEIPFRIRIGKGFFTDKKQQKGNARFFEEIEQILK